LRKRGEAGPAKRDSPVCSPIRPSKLYRWTANALGRPEFCVVTGEQAMLSIRLSCYAPENAAIHQS
jgi:hypothetical protein